MDVFRTDRIRNVVLLGHSGSGKTSLTEAMAYLSGMTNRLGKVTDGNTVSDFDKEEIKRKCSISTTLVPVVWGKNKINVLDTPGMFDFVGEAQEAASAADAAVIVVSGKAGVQVGTQKAWELCEKYNLPRMIFVTEMDQDDVSYREVVEQLTELYGKRIAPLHMPLRENGKFVGYINIVKNKGRRYIEKDKKEEFMFLGLRMIEGISKEKFHQAFDRKYDSVYGEVTEKLVQQGLIEVNGDNVRLTKKGVDLSNYAMSQFLL